MRIQIDAVKQMNSKNKSNDANATINRCTNVWYELSKRKREELLEIAGVSKYSIYKTMRNGFISVRVALAFALVSDISPYYFINKDAERDKCTEALCESFIKTNWNSNVNAFDYITSSEDTPNTVKESIEIRIRDILQDETLMENAKMVSNEQLISLLQAAFIKLDIEGRESNELIFLKALALKGL